MSTLVHELSMCMTPSIYHQSFQTVVHFILRRTHTSHGICSSIANAAYALCTLHLINYIYYIIIADLMGFYLDLLNAFCFAICSEHRRAAQTH